VNAAGTRSTLVERDPDTRLYVGYVPGRPGAHSQGATLNECNYSRFPVW
jgi:predicted RNase H-like HicB family nuclease